MSVPEKLQKVENQNSAWIHRMKTRGWLCGAEQDWGVGGWPIHSSMRDREQRERMGGCCELSTRSPANNGVGRRGAYLNATLSLRLHDSHRRHRHQSLMQSSCHHHLSITCAVISSIPQSLLFSRLPVPYRQDSLNICPIPGILRHILPSIQKVYEFLMGHYLASPVHCTNMPRVALNQQWISCMIRSYSEGFQLSPAQNTNPGGVSDSWYGFGARESRSPACHPGIWAIRALVYGSSYSSGTPWGFAQCYPWYVLSCMCSRHFLACALLGMMMRCPMWCSWFMLHCIILISANTFHTSVQPIARYVLLRVMWSPKQQQQQQQR